MMNVKIVRGNSVLAQGNDEEREIVEREEQDILRTRLSRNVIPRYVSNSIYRPDDKPIKSTLSSVRREEIPEITLSRVDRIESDPITENVRNVVNDEEVQKITSNTVTLNINEVFKPTEEFKVQSTFINPNDDKEKLEEGAIEENTNDTTNSILRKFNLTEKDFEEPKDDNVDKEDSNVKIDQEYYEMNEKYLDEQDRNFTRGRNKKKDMLDRY